MSLNESFELIFQSWVEAFRSDAKINDSSAWNGKEEKSEEEEEEDNVTYVNNLVCVWCASLSMGWLARVQFAPPIFALNPAFSPWLFATLLIT